MQPKEPMPPEAVRLEQRLTTGGPWALFSFILILCGMVGLSKGLAPLFAVLLLSTAFAATGHRRLVHRGPAFVGIWRFRRRRDRDRTG